MIGKWNCTGQNGHDVCGGSGCVPRANEAEGPATHSWLPLRGPLFSYICFMAEYFLFTFNKPREGLAISKLTHSFVGSILSDFEGFNGCKPLYDIPMWIEFNIRFFEWETRKGDRRNTPRSVSRTQRA